MTFLEWVRMGRMDEEAVHLCLMRSSEVLCGLYLLRLAAFLALSSHEAAARMEVQKGSLYRFDDSK